MSRSLFHLSKLVFRAICLCLSLVFRGSRGAFCGHTFSYAIESGRCSSTPVLCDGVSVVVYGRLAMSFYRVCGFWRGRFPFFFLLAYSVYLQCRVRLLRAVFFSLGGLGTSLVSLHTFSRTLPLMFLTGRVASLPGYGL